MKPTTTYSRMKSAVVKTTVAVATAFSLFFTADTALAHKCSGRVLPGKQKPASHVIEYKTEVKKEGKKKVKVKTDEIKKVTLVFPVEKGKTKQMLSMTMPGELFKDVEGADNVDGIMYSNAEVVVDRHQKKGNIRAWTWKCDETPRQLPSSEEAAPEGWKIGDEGNGKKNGTDGETAKPAPVEKEGKWQYVRVKPPTRPESMIKKKDGSAYGESPSESIALTKDMSGSIRSTLDRLLKRNPYLTGRVTVMISVDKQGYVSRVGFEGESVTDEFVQKYSDLFRRVRFKPSANGFSIKIPLILSSN